MSDPATISETELATIAALEAGEFNPAYWFQFWFELIDEKEMAKFLNFSTRHMQGMRYRGGGPKFIRVSSRCVKYRRWEGREWSEARLVSSTSDPGGERQ